MKYGNMFVIFYRAVVGGIIFIFKLTNKIEKVCLVGTVIVLKMKSF